MPSIFTLISDFSVYSVPLHPPIHVPLSSTNHLDNSNCGAKNDRLEVVKELQREGIIVHSYGSCLHNKEEDRSLGKHNIIAKYPFYLAFENSNDDDYITEKFWQCLSAGTLCITYGPTNYERFAPQPGSTLHIKSIDDVPRVAAEMKYLLSNRTAYEQRLSWKRHGPTDEFKALVDLSVVHSECRTCVYVASVYMREKGEEWRLAQAGEGEQTEREQRKQKGELAEKKNTEEAGDSVREGRRGARRSEAAPRARDGVDSFTSPPLFMTPPYCKCDLNTLLAGGAAGMSHSPASSSSDNARPSSSPSASSRSDSLHIVRPPSSFTRGPATGSTPSFFHWTIYRVMVRERGRYYYVPIYLPQSDLTLAGLSRAIVEGLCDSAAVSANQRSGGLTGRRQNKEDESGEEAGQTDAEQSHSKGKKAVKDAGYRNAGKAAIGEGHVGGVKASSSGDVDGDRCLYEPLWMRERRADGRPSMYLLKEWGRDAEKVLEDERREEERYRAQERHANSSEICENAIGRSKQPMAYGQPVAASGYSHMRIYRIYPSHVTLREALHGSGYFMSDRDVFEYVTTHSDTDCTYLDVIFV